MNNAHLHNHSKVVKKQTQPSLSIINNLSSTQLKISAAPSTALALLGRSAIQIDGLGDENIIVCRFLCKREGGRFYKSRLDLNCFLGRSFIVRNRGFSSALAPRLGLVLAHPPL